MQQIALQALGSRRSRTPVRLKWLEAGQGVDAIFTPTLNLVRFSPKRVCRRHMLPGCQDYQVASKTTSLRPNPTPQRPITARIHILALHVPTTKRLRGLLLAPPLPRFSSAIHRPRMSDGASNFNDQVPGTACWEVARLSDASPLIERLIG